MAHPTTFNVECEEKSTNRKEDVEGVFKKRYIQGGMIFSLFILAFIFRGNLSVAIVAMTDRQSANPDFEELDWNLKTRSEILSSFFWGYLVIQLPAGQLGQLFSVKQLLLWANTACALLALLTPITALYGGWFLVCFLRFLQGISQGFYPALSYTLISKWVPLHERNRFVGFSMSGSTLGSVVSLAMSGLLASSSGGWPSVFYVSGALGLVWSALWLLLGADSPLSHPTIDPLERDYIQAALTDTSQTQTYPTPWRSIFTSVPVWAIIAVAIGAGWGFSIMMTQLPTYIHSVLGFDIKQNGFLSALPNLSMWVFTFPVCWLADYLGKHKILSTVTIRKLYTSLCLGGGALTVLSLCLVDRNAVAAMTLITISITFTAFLFNGFNMNYLDLSPNFAGVLMGLCNGLENISTILAPLSVGWIVSDPTSVTQWRRVFMVSGTLALLGNTIYVILGSADIQPWNTPITDGKRPK